MKPPKQTQRAHNRTVTLAPEAYAAKLETYAVAQLVAVVKAYRDASAEVQALLLARPVFVAALAWASSH